jgi:hypothetical protein
MALALAVHFAAERRTPGSSADSVVWADLNLTLIRTTLMAAVVALTIALIGCSRGNDAAGMPSEPATPPGAFASAAGQFNDADVIFAQHMILRHEQAVAMSDMVLRKPASTPKSRRSPSESKPPSSRRSTN